MTYKVKVSYDNDDSLRIWVDGNELEYTFAKDFEGTYNGGYIGFLTWQTEAKFENIRLTPEGTTVYNNNLPNYAARGSITELSDGYKMFDINDNNYGVSSVSSKEFVYETTIQYNGGSNCASVVFGAQSDKYGQLGSQTTFFGLEFYKDGSGNIFTKLFQDGPGVRGNEFISRGASVGTAVDKWKRSEVIISDWYGEGTDREIMNRILEIDFSLFSHENLGKFYGDYLWAIARPYVKYRESKMYLIFGCGYIETYESFASDPDGEGFMPVTKVDREETLRVNSAYYPDLYGDDYFLDESAIEDDTLIFLMKMMQSLNGQCWKWNWRKKISRLTMNMRMSSRMKMTSMISTLTKTMMIFPA